MTWPTDDLDMSAPHYERDKLKAAVDKTKAILTSDVRENTYYIALSIDVGANSIEVFEKPTGWTLAYVSDTDISVTHNLGLTDLDQFDVQITGDGLASDSNTFDGRGLTGYTKNITANAFTIVARDIHPDYGVGGLGGTLNILCQDHASAGAFPTDNLTTTALDQGTDTTVAGRAELYPAMQALQTVLASPFPANADLFGLVVAHSAEQSGDIAWMTNPGIVTRSNSAAGWTYTGFSNKRFRITHNLGLASEHQLYIGLTWDKAQHGYPAFTGGTNDVALGPFVSTRTSQYFDVMCTSARGSHNFRCDGVIHIVCKRVA